MVGKVEEMLDPVQGHFGLKESLITQGKLLRGRMSMRTSARAVNTSSGVRGGWGRG